MENDDRLQQLEDPSDEQVENQAQEAELLGRRDFLRSLNKWSMAVIGGAIAGGLLSVPEANGWVNSRGSWANRSGGGAAWANRGATWVNGGRAVVTGGNWINRGGAWINGGGGWVNRSGGAGWINGHGGGGSAAWVNRRG